MAEDPFDNHPLFKTEEQARIEETMSGQDSFEEESAAFAWPTEEELVVPATVEAEPNAESDEGLWTRSRDFDWGD